MPWKIEGLKCPYCACRNNKVTHTEQQEFVWRGKPRTRTRRRRVCLNPSCGVSFFTYETTESLVFSENRPPPSDAPEAPQPNSSPKKDDGLPPNPYLSK